MTSKKFKIVDASNKDIFWVLSNKELFGHPINAKVLDDLHSAVFVAKSNGNIVGYIATVIKNKDLEIRDLSTRKGMQGLGIGKKLMGAAHAYAIRKGLTWSTLRSMESARGFYQRLGYRSYLGDHEKPLNRNPRRAIKKIPQKPL